MSTNEIISRDLVNDNKSSNDSIESLYLSNDIRLLTILKLLNSEYLLSKEETQNKSEKKYKINIDSIIDRMSNVISDISIQDLEDAITMSKKYKDVIKEIELHKSNVLSKQKIIDEQNKMIKYKNDLVETLMMHREDY